MKSRERVQRALNFDKPDRIPIFKYPPYTDVFPLVNLPLKSWQPNEKNIYPHLISDIIRQLRLYRWKKPIWAPKDWYRREREEIDQWGCYWNRCENDKTMGHPGRPAIDTWDKLDSWEGPDAGNKKAYSLFNKLSKLFFRKYKVAIIHDIIFIMNRVSMLRGFTNLLIDHHRHPKQVHTLIKKVTDIFMQNIEMLVEYKPDGVWACDDLGTQQAPFFSADLFKKFYAAPYKKIINFLHDYDCTFHLHSCGNIGDLIPTLIEIGVDSLEFDSPRLTGFERLREFKGKIPFWACVNIQSVYPLGTPTDIETEVKEMIQTFSTQEGGFLAYFYPDTHVINVPKKNIKAFRNALKKWGKYPIEFLS
ncbi:MAG: uroporphyrinogen decarboxylase family protein [Candidatus Helarchaeota archaeon]